MIGLTVSADRVDVSQAVKDGTREALHSAAQVGFAESQRLVAEASGDLKQSGALRRSDTSATFGYDADHAPYVEGGTDPHWPPIEPLQEWAELVLGDRSAAWPIQKKIAEEGTPPQPFIQPGFEAMARELQRRGITADIEGHL